MGAFVIDAVLRELRGEEAVKKEEDGDGSSQQEPPSSASISSADRS
jgi:hypothetical protein